MKQRFGRTRAFRGLSLRVAGQVWWEAAGTLLVCVKVEPRDGVAPWLRLLRFM